MNKKSYRVKSLEHTKNVVGIVPPMKRSLNKIIKCIPHNYWANIVFEPNRLGNPKPVHGKFIKGFLWHINDLKCVDF